MVSTMLVTLRLVSSPVGSAFRALSVASSPPSEPVPGRASLTFDAASLTDPTGPAALSAVLAMPAAPGAASARSPILSVAPDMPCPSRERPRCAMALPSSMTSSLSRSTGSSDSTLGAPLDSWVFFAAISVAPCSCRRLGAGPAGLRAGASARPSWACPGGTRGCTVLGLVLLVGLFLVLLVLRGVLVGLVLVGLVLVVLVLRLVLGLGLVLVLVVFVLGLVFRLG